MRTRLPKHPVRVTALTASALVLLSLGLLQGSASAEESKPAPAATNSSTTTVAPAQAKPAPAAPVTAKVPAAKTKVNSLTSTPATATTKPAPAPTVAPTVPVIPIQKSKTAQPVPSKTGGVTTQQPVAGHPAGITSKTSTAAPATVVAGKPASTGIQPTAQLDEHLTYQYNALGRRDPFQALVGGDYVGADVGGDAPPDIGGIKVVGIVWGDADKFALVEDGRGESHVLRRGDKVMNGFVENLTREGIVVSLTTDGQTQSVNIPLTRKGEKNGNR